MKNKKSSGLWTRDFTILTLGSMVSLFGNSLSGFAIGLLVLDYTESNLLFAVFIAIYTVPQMIMPIFSGAILDRFSRKKMIYTLDFISAALYASAALTLWTGMFSFPVLAVYCFFIGSINSIYMVAYESFYPLLITEGYYSKAYSISSVLQTLSAVMVPLSAYLYGQIGIAPLLAINAACFFIAAVVETQIHTDEKYIASQKENLVNKDVGRLRLIFEDIIEGFKYLLSQKGLLLIAVYFTFSAMSQGATTAITLPFFKSSFTNGEYVYMLVFGMQIVGRAVGGIIHYKIKIPAKIKYRIAFTVYIVTSVLEGVFLYFNIPVMMVMCFASGILGITSYTIRISAVQKYVPDEKKGRFNGAFVMLNTVGSFGAELLAGALAEFISPRYVLSGFLACTLIAALVFIGGGRREISQIYNTEQ